MREEVVRGERQVEERQVEGKEMRGEQEEEADEVEVGSGGTEEQQVGA